MTSSPAAPAAAFVPLSTLMPGIMPSLGEDLAQRGAVVGLLADGLVVQDDAADELGHPRRGEEHLAVDAADLFGVLDAERLKRFAMVRMALVGGEDALAGGHQRAGSGLELRDDHRMPPL